MELAVRVASMLRASSDLHEYCTPHDVYDFVLGRDDVCVLRTAGGDPRILKFRSPRRIRDLAREASHHQIACELLLDQRPLHAYRVFVPQLRLASMDVLVSDLFLFEGTVRDTELTSKDVLNTVIEATVSALARLHKDIPVGDAPAPWFVQLLDERRHVFNYCNAQQLEFVRELIEDDSSRRTLRSVARVLQSDAFIHNDLRASNVLINHSRRAIAIIDWESSGRGDRRWDLGCLLGEILLGVMGSRVEARSLVRRGAELAEMLVDVYEREARVSLADADYLPKFSGVWLLQQAFEHLYEPGSTHETIAYVRGLGRALLCLSQE